MQAEMEFFIACVPFKVTHHSKKIVRIGNFSKLADSPQLRHARVTYEQLLAKYQPKEPFNGPIALTLFFYFPFLKSAPKKTQYGRAPKLTKPDCSNLAKTFEDCLVRMRFIDDDASVTKLLVQKAYRGMSGIKVKIERDTSYDEQH